MAPRCSIMTMFPLLQTTLHCNGKLIAETAEFFKTETSRAIECSTIVVLDLADLA